MTEAILQVRNLTKHFGGLAAVENISLEVRRREIHAVIGPNGAGKSTLINLLVGRTARVSGRNQFPRTRYRLAYAGKTLAYRHRPELSKDQHISGFHGAGELPLGGAIPRTAPVALGTRCSELRIDHVEGATKL